MYHLTTCAILRMVLMCAIVDLSTLGLVVGQERSPQKVPSQAPDKRTGDEHIVSAKDAKIEEKQLPDFSTAVVIDLGTCEGFPNGTQQFVIRDLPPGYQVVLGVGQFKESKLVDVCFSSMAGALGVEKLGVEWKVRGAREAFVSELTRNNKGPLRIQDQEQPEKWATQADKVYELNLTAVRTAKDRSMSDLPKNPHWLLVAVSTPVAASQQDTRPVPKRVIDHGAFSRKNIVVNYLQFKTPADKYILELGEAEVSENTVHKYTISDLPSGLIFHFGFSTDKPSDSPPIVALGKPLREEQEKAKDSLLRQTGTRRIHVHLATTEGFVLMSREFDLTNTFQGSNFVTQGAHIDWSFTDNTASGSNFVPKKGCSYLLEILILEVDSEAKSRMPLLPMIKS